MKTDWLYSVPTWLSGTLTVVAFVAFGLAGLYLTRGWVRRLDNPEDHAYNHIVGFYMAGVTVLYAVCAGLLAIGAWATYSDVQGKVDHEATALGALYRDIGAYPEPARTILQQDLRTYTRQVIDVGWPMQRRRNRSQQRERGVERLSATLYVLRTSGRETENRGRRSL